MSVNNTIIGQGVGGDILDDPQNALKWFLDFEFSDNNFPKAGDVISLGSLVQTYWVKKNDVIEIDIENLGDAKIIFK
jgi:2-keto-4-pentenoate hydratase